MSTVGIVVVLVYYLWIHTVPAYFCFRKGKVGMGLVGIIVPLVGVIGALRLAKPDSRHALANYGPEKMREATARYPDRAANVPEDWKPTPEAEERERLILTEQDSQWDDLAPEDMAGMDKITRKGLKKAGRLS